MKVVNISAVNGQVLSQIDVSNITPFAQFLFDYNGECSFDGVNQNLLYSAILENGFSADNAKIYSLSTNSSSTSSANLFQQDICETIQVSNCTSDSSYEGTIYLVDTLSQTILLEKVISMTNCNTMVDHLIVKYGLAE